MGREASANRVERARKTRSLAGEILRPPLKGTHRVGGIGGASGLDTRWAEDARKSLGTAQVRCRGRGPRGWRCVLAPQCRMPNSGWVS